MQEILFAGIALTVAGFFVLFVQPLAERYRIFYVGIPVNAVVSERKEKTVRGQKRIKLVWQFTYEGNDRQYQSHYWQPEDERNVGYRGALLLRKNNTEKIYEFMPAHIKTVLKAAGITLIAAGMIFIAVFFYMRGTIGLFSLK